MLRRSTIFLFVCVLCFAANAQEHIPYVEDSIIFIPNEKECQIFFKKASKKCDRLSDKIRKTTDFYLTKYEQTEDKVFNSICFLDEKHAESLMRNALFSHRRLESEISANDPRKSNNSSPEFDSLSIALDFLETRSLNRSIANDSSACSCSGMSDLRASQERLKKELKRSEKIGEYVQQRSAYLSKLGQENEGIRRGIVKAEKINYYFGAQSKEHLALFEDRSNPEKVFFKFLNSSPEFKTYLERLSAPPPPNSAAMQGTNVPANQNFELVMREFRAAADAKGLDIKEITNPLKNLKNNELKEKKTEDVLSELKDKTQEDCELYEGEKDSLSLKTENKDDWTPNPLKTKRFLDRVVTGFNFQASERTQFFPTAGLITAQISYQMTTRVNIGVGGSYIGGFSRRSNSSELQLPHFGTNGIGLRSFVDWKFKNRLFLQVNYELYQRENLSESANSQLSQNSRSVIPSFLVGFKLKKAATKRSQPTIELLYDFLHTQNGQPALVVRMGMDIMPRHSYKH
jgi:hypothetical protein